MDVLSALSEQFPDRPPTWNDIVIAVIAISWMPLYRTDLGEISWAMAMGGFVSFFVIRGPVANSTIGMRFGSWWKAIGLRGRAVGIILYAVGVWITSQLIYIPVTLVSSIVAGGMLAIAVFVFLRVLSAREVSGWV